MGTGDHPKRGWWLRVRRRIWVLLDAAERRFEEWLNPFTGPHR